MELFLVAAIVASVLITALFGVVCVRYTTDLLRHSHPRSLAGALVACLQVFLVTGGTDGLRVPTPSLFGRARDRRGDKIAFMSHAYYYYVLIVFCLCVG